MAYHNKVKNFIHDWIWIMLAGFLIVGMFYPAVAVAAIACMLAPVAVAFFHGRSWCGAYCPRGSFLDRLGSLLGTKKKKLPRLFTQKWFRYGFMAVLLSLFAWQMYFAFGDITAMGRVFFTMVTITTLGAILLALPFRERSWCMICPMGTMAAAVTRMRSIRKTKGIRIDAEKCTSCTACSKACKTGIQIHQYRAEGIVAHADCISCGKCVDKCPRQALESA